MKEIRFLITYQNSKKLLKNFSESNLASDIITRLINAFYLLQGHNFPEIVLEDLAIHAHPEFVKDLESEFSLSRPYNYLFSHNIEPTFNGVRIVRSVTIEKDDPILVVFGDEPKITVLEDSQRFIHNYLKSMQELKIKELYDDTINSNR